MMNIVAARFLSVRNMFNLHHAERSAAAALPIRQTFLPLAVFYLLRTFVSLPTSLSLFAAFHFCHNSFHRLNQHQSSPDNIISAVTSPCSAGRIVYYSYHVKNRLSTAVETYGVLEPEAS